MADVYDCIVVGKGMMGASAARHLSATSSSSSHETNTPRIAIIGPDEPADLSAHTGVFSSHYDQGRVTRVLGADKIWTRLNALSLDEYPTLERDSGVRFHTPARCIYVAREPDLQRVDALAHDNHISCTRYADASSTPDHPSLSFPSGFSARCEPPPAGYINPRAFIEAELVIARKQGVDVFAETVESLEKRGTHWHVRTKNGSYLAKKVLVATGAYANSLLPRKLALRVKSETVLFARVSKEEAARSAFPPVLYRVESPAISSIYLLPPILYPDGHYYAKMGCNTKYDQNLPHAADMRHWMARGDGSSDAAAPEMQAAMRALLPSLHVLAYSTGRCLVTYSAHGKPYVDCVDGDSLFVATAGNGASAKCADALGLIAACLVLGRPWPAGLDRHDFRAQFASKL